MRASGGQLAVRLSARQSWYACRREFLLPSIDIHRHALPRLSTWPADGATAGRPPLRSQLTAASRQGPNDNVAKLFPSSRLRLAPHLELTLRHHVFVHSPATTHPFSVTASSHCPLASCVLSGFACLYCPLFFRAGLPFRPPTHSITRVCALLFVCPLAAFSHSWPLLCIARYHYTPLHLGEPSRERWEHPV